MVVPGKLAQKHQSKSFTYLYTLRVGCKKQSNSACWGWLQNVQIWIDLVHACVQKFVVPGFHVGLGACQSETKAIDRRL